MSRFNVWLVMLAILGLRALIIGNMSAAEVDAGMWFSAAALLLHWCMTDKKSKQSANHSGH